MSWKAGTASTVITPNEPLWLAGYAARKAPASGKISDLHAKALALEDEVGRKFVLITTDLIAVTHEMWASISLTLLMLHGVNPEMVLLCSSHTHYGPEIRPDKAIFFGIPGEFAAKISGVARKILLALTDVAVRAVKDLRPAQVFVRRTNAGFADNRRSDGGVTDHDVPVLDVVGEDGNRRAIVFGYACHNTTIPPEDCRYCCDWAGFAQEQLEHDHPGTTALFITGAAADQNPHPRGSVELSRQHGAALADAVAVALRAPGRAVQPRLRAAMERVPLALQLVTHNQLEVNIQSADAPVARKAKFLLDQIERGEPLITEYPAPLQAIRFGEELLLIALSGEPVNDYAHHFKQRFAGEGQIWIAGYCNDMFGYLPTRRIQQEGGYEGGRANLWSWIPSPWTDDVEDRVTSAVERLVQATRG